MIGIKKTENLFFALMLLLVLLLLLSIYLNKIKIYKVDSGSMEPSIHRNSLIFVAPKLNYSVNEVITYKKNSSTVTHRIESINDSEVRTKGDSNKVLDLDPVSIKKIIGKVVFVIPFLGLISNKTFLLITLLFLGFWYVLPKLLAKTSK